MLYRHRLNGSGWGVYESFFIRSHAVPRRRASYDPRTDATDGLRLREPLAASVPLPQLPQQCGVVLQPPLASGDANGDVRNEIACGRSD